MSDETPLCPDPSDHLRVADLERALKSNRVIGAAVGIVMTRQLLTYDQAFDLLRRASSRLNCRVADLAAQVVETGTIPSGLTAAGNSRGSRSPGRAEETPRRR